MPKYRSRPPQLQLAGGPFVTDGGIETTLIFREGLQLPEFAAFDLLKTEAGAGALKAYFRTYAEMALRHGMGLILESPTWRANPDWGRKIGYSEKDLLAANRQAISLLADLRNALETPQSPFVISGNIGPRGDGYVPSALMTAQEAEAYHGWQVAAFAETEADMVAAFTMNYVGEAVGVAKAARRHRMPVAISFTVETDGKLPTGHSLGQAIEETDAATEGYPAYYMINCAHPAHFLGALDPAAGWTRRIRGLRANASAKSHAELNEAVTLDDGDPADLGRRYAEARRLLPNLRVIGGCCGTDHRHVEEMCKALSAKA